MSGMEGGMLEGGGEDWTPDMMAFSLFSSYSVVFTDERHGGRDDGGRRGRTGHQTCWHSLSFLHILLCLQMSGMEGGMLEGGGEDWTPDMMAFSPLVPDGRIQGRWTQKWPSKISCGLESQRPRKRPNSKFPNCGLILTIIGKNWPKNL